MTHPLVIAHRGASAFERENTLPAIVRAVDAGADMVEVDVRQTRDGALVLHHDRTIAGRPLRKLTLDEFCGLARRHGYEAATLSEAALAVRSRARLLAEVKRPGHEAAVLKALADALPLDGFMISSYSARVLGRLRHLEPRLETGYVTVSGGVENVLRAGRHHAGAAAPDGARPPDAFVVHKGTWRLASWARGRRHKPQLFVWTVNHDRELRRLLRSRHVDGVITDDPGRAVALRNGGHG